MNPPASRSSEDERPSAWQGGPAGVVLPAVVVALYAQQVRVHQLLADDAFISFRYAAHLADGRGLVWNTGEWVEGYTNLLWVLVLAVGIRLGVQPEVLAPTLGIFCATLVLAATAQFSAGRFGWTDPLIWAAPLLMAANRSFAAWGTAGLETQAFTLVCFLAVVHWLREAEQKPTWAWRSSVLLGLAAMTRPDGAVIAVALGIAYLALVVRKERTLGSLARWVAPAAAMVGAHLAFRLVMYGKPLPNTFYVKVNGFDWEMTSRYFGFFLTDFKWHWLLPLVGLALVARRDRVTAVLAWVLGFYLTFVAYVGGDFLEFRFFVHVMPLMYLLVEDGLRCARTWLRERPGPRVAGSLVFVLLLGVVGLTAHGGGLKPQKDWPGVSTLATIRDFCAARITDGRFLRALMDDGLLPSDVRIATRGAGALPYYTDAYVVDIMGLSDSRVARMKPVDGVDHAGHQKMATDQMLRRRDLDLIDAGPGGLVTDVKLKSYADKPFESRWYTGAIRVIPVQGRLLFFGSHKTPEELEARFPRLDLAHGP